MGLGGTTRTGSPSVVVGEKREAGGGTVRVAEVSAASQQVDPASAAVAGNLG